MVVHLSIPQSKFRNPQSLHHFVSLNFSRQQRQTRCADQEHYQPGCPERRSTSERIDLFHSHAIDDRLLTYKLAEQPAPDVPDERLQVEQVAPLSAKDLIHDDRENRRDKEDSQQNCAPRAPPAPPRRE